MPRSWDRYTAEARPAEAVMVIYGHPCRGAMTADDFSGFSVRTTLEDLPADLPRLLWRR